MTAGTMMHRSHLPLRVWFLAAHIVTSHSNGISALQLQPQPQLSSYKTAWLMLHKLGRAMVDPNRSPIAETIDALIAGASPHAPVGCVAIDVDCYFSAVDALKLFEARAELLMPLVNIYLDDVHDPCHSPSAG